jgi:hypothetical protein
VTGYAVNTYDCAGQHSEARCETFEEALQLYRELRAKHQRGKVVAVFNLDRCDLNFDGLTEPEREALDGAAGA